MHSDATSAQLLPPSGDGPADDIQRAFRMAYFIHSCLSDDTRRAKAKEIAIAALEKRPVLAKEQRKRGYYQPKGQIFRALDPLTIFKGKARSKIILEEVQLLQCLVFKVSEEVERGQENGPSHVPLSQADMLKRYLAYLVRTTMERSAFYVTLALCRFVYNYDAGETETLYRLVIQDSENRHKPTEYFRKQKGDMIERFQQRFGDRLRLAQGSRSELHFERVTAPEQFAELLEECLAEFRPWSVDCCLPERFNRHDRLPTLKFEGGRDDSQVELKRIHTLLHPECFAKLVKAWEFEQPSKRLGLPLFYPPKGGQSE